MDIRQLQYLVALAREKHFTRAAAACHVTQSTLSGRIAQLEQELGVPIVARGQRFQGFTVEGQRVLGWANAILEQWQGMRKDLEQVGDASLHGRLSIAVIPSALTSVPLLAGAMRALHPDVSFSLLSHSSVDIIAGLQDLRFDAGVTFLDNESIAGMRSCALYRERYCLFVRRDHAMAGLAEVSWEAAATEPLALLTPDMQYRRIIDRAFQLAGCQPMAQLESNSVLTLSASIATMGMVSILPDYYFATLGGVEQLVAVPLMGPVMEHTVGLIAQARDPVAPLVAALFAAAAAADFSPLRKRLPDSMAEVFPPDLEPVP